MLDAMSYIIVRSDVSQGTEKAFYGITYIEYEEEIDHLQAAMSRLSAKLVTNYPFLYKTTEPPYIVLNRLKSLGYHVVTANSIADLRNSHWQIWTLCS